MKETGMLGCKPIDTLIDVNHRLRLSQGAIVDIERYQRLVGKLNFLAHTQSTWHL